MKQLSTWRSVEKTPPIHITVRQMRFRWMETYESRSIALLAIQQTRAASTPLPFVMYECFNCPCRRGLGISAAHGMWNPNPHLLLRPCAQSIAIYFILSPAGSRWLWMNLLMAYWDAKVQQGPSTRCRWVLVKGRAACAAKMANSFFSDRSFEVFCCRVGKRLRPTSQHFFGCARWRCIQTLSSWTRRCRRRSLVRVANPKLVVKLQRYEAPDPKKTYEF